MTKNVFNSMMEFRTTKFDNYYIATNSSIPCYLEQVARLGVSNSISSQMLRSLGSS